MVSVCVSGVHINAAIYADFSAEYGRSGILLDVWPELINKYVPILEELGTQGQLRINSNFTFFISKQFFFYPLIGYYIDRCIR